MFDQNETPQCLMLATKGRERAPSADEYVLLDSAKLRSRASQQIVTDAISRTDLDLWKAFYANIVLSGCSSLTNGKTRQ
ncbi:hypothetical protein DL768_004544 [Monosporascus sp. mg162]|nr:hypothetical protein DL768_004544 [Monosporascus sp. mg162]